MNANDFLQYTLAAGIAVFTFFLAWLMWMVIALMRDARSMLGEVRSMVDRVKTGMESFEQLLSSIGERVAQSGTFFSLLTKLGGKVVQSVNNRKRKRTNSATDKNG